MNKSRLKRIGTTEFVATFFALLLLLGSSSCRATSALAPGHEVAPSVSQEAAIAEPHIYPLTHTKQKIQTILDGGQEQLVVATIGDSWTGNDNTNLGPAFHAWGKTVADALRCRLGDAGQGWISLSNLWGKARGNISPEKISTPSFSAGWVTTQDPTLYGTTDSPDITEVRSSKVGATITISGTTPCDIIYLFYKVVPASSITYRFNGEAITNLDTATGSGIASLEGIPTGVWTLKISIASGEPVLYGLDVKRKNPGLRWHNIAAAGASTAQWSQSADRPAWQTNFGALTPDLVTILLATNDQFNPVADFKTRMQGLISSIRKATPESDILLIAPTENGLPGRIPMAKFKEALSELSAKNHLPVLDLQPLFGSTYAEYNFDSPHPLFIDEIHPSIAGAQVIATAVLHHLWHFAPISTASEVGSKIQIGQ